MKRIITIAFLSLPLLFGCTDDSASIGGASSVILSKDRVDLLVGESAHLTAKVLPTSLDMGVEWSVIDSLYADVKDGVVTGKKEGVTYVVATSKDGKKKGSCLVSVNPPSRYAVSLRDVDGETVTGIYGYPGMSMELTAVTDDSQPHELIWSVDDIAAATVTQEGKITLSAAASESPDYLYDARSFLRVVSEDGSGCKVPVRSSILNGVKVDEDFQTAASLVTVLKSQKYPLALLYQLAEGTASVPVDAYEFVLGNTTDFSISEENGVYMLSTGETTGVTTKLSIKTAASTEPVEMLEIKIDKVYEIKASFLGTATSSTLAFTWTEGGTAAEDIANAYTAVLYRDSECTEAVRTFEIPANIPQWNNKTPKFVFAGLSPSTTYWFRVFDTTNTFESNAVKATTADFTLVQMPATITTTGVALAEDFGELRWDTDFPNDAVGYTSSDKSDFSNSEVSNWRKPGDSGEITFKGQGTALSKSTRLNNWVTDSNVYIHPGYLKLGTSSARGWILTPEFTVPEGKKAIVRVDVTIARLNSSQDTKWSLTVLTPALAKATPSSHSADFAWPDVSKSTCYQEVTVTQTNVWETLSVTNLELHPGDRIAFGGTKEGSSSKGRVQISDMTVTVTSIVDE